MRLGEIDEHVVCHGSVYEIQVEGLNSLCLSARDEAGRDKARLER